MKIVAKILSFVHFVIKKKMNKDKINMKSIVIIFTFVFNKFLTLPELSVELDNS